jgi:hypothetical protein
MQVNIQLELFWEVAGTYGYWNDTAEQFYLRLIYTKEMRNEYAGME